MQDHLFDILILSLMHMRSDLQTNDIHVPKRLQHQQNLQKRLSAQEFTDHDSIRYMFLSAAATSTRGTRDSGETCPTAKLRPVMDFSDAGFRRCCSCCCRPNPGPIRYRRGGISVTEKKKLNYRKRSSDPE